MSTQNEGFYQDLTHKGMSPAFLKIFLGIAGFLSILSLIQLCYHLLQGTFTTSDISYLLNIISVVCLGIFFIQRSKNQAPAGSYFVRIHAGQIDYQGAGMNQPIQVSIEQIKQCYQEWNRIDIKVDGKPWVHIQARGPKQAKLIYQKLQSIMPQPTALAS